MKGPTKILLYLLLTIIASFTYANTSSSTISIGGTVPQIGDYRISVTHNQGFGPYVINDLESAAGTGLFSIGTLEERYVGNLSSNQKIQWKVRVSSTNNFHLKQDADTVGEYLIPYIMVISWQEVPAQGQSEPAGSWNSSVNGNNSDIIKGDNRVHLIQRDISIQIPELQELFPGGTYKDRITFTISAN